MNPTSVLRWQFIGESTVGSDRFLMQVTTTYCEPYDCPDLYKKFLIDKGQTLMPCDVSIVSHHSASELISHLYICTPAYALSEINEQQITHSRVFHINMLFFLVQENINISTIIHTLCSSLHQANVNVGFGPSYPQDMNLQTFRSTVLICSTFLSTLILF